MNGDIWRWLHDPCEFAYAIALVDAGELIAIAAHDGSWFVDWDKASALASTSKDPREPENGTRALCQILVAARGRFAETTWDEALIIARAAARAISDAGVHWSALQAAGTG